MSQYTVAMSSDFNTEELSELYGTIFNSVRPSKLKLDFGGNYTHKMDDGTSHKHESDVYKHFKLLYERFGENLEVDNLDAKGKPPSLNSRAKHIPELGFTKWPMETIESKRLYRILVWNIETGSNLYKMLFTPFKKEVEKIAKVEKHVEEHFPGCPEEYFVILDPPTKQLFEITTLLYEKTKGWITTLDVVIPATFEMGEYISENKNDITYMTLISDKCQGSISMPPNCPPPYKTRKVGLYFQKDIPVSSFGEFLNSLMK